MPLFLFSAIVYGAYTIRS